MIQQAADTIVITGAGAGIGRAIAEHRIARGDQVVGISHQPAGFECPGFTSVISDLTQAGDLRAASRRAAQSGATGLVHNAGAIRPARLGSVSDIDLDYVVDLHLRALIHLTQAMLPAMEAAGRGRIVLISSRAALGLPTRTVYSATKAALIGLGRTWALELADRRVTVNIVSPGPIETDQLRDLIPEGSEAEEELVSNIPLGRIGQPDDVAGAVDFFLDPASSFVTGQNLFVCGGTSVGSSPL